MRAFYPIIFGSIVVFVFGLSEVLLIRFLHRDWWRRRWVKWTAIGLPLAGVACIFLWALGTVHNIRWVLAIGATGTSLTLVLELALMLSLPFSGALEILRHLLDRVFRKKAAAATTPADPKRRVFLKATAAALPTVAITAGATGIAYGFTPVRLPIVEMTFPDLPPALEGLKILQLSDMHLGLYQHLVDLETVLGSARQLSPDLILVTGDIADDLDILPETLRMIARFDAPLGQFAALGNHEYYRGIQQVRRIFDAGPVPLLAGAHAVVEVGGTTLIIAGADDPRVMGEDDTAFLRQTTDAAMDGAPGEGFTILMSHRPEGLNTAADLGIPLTLAGHTHGGQFGWFGRSMFEPWLPHRYLWGKYTKDKAQLYTSAGVGHWFPFRLGCPPEAPLIVLKRGDLPAEG
jgi:predicted MPP superfamily phosphohydrolase